MPDDDVLAANPDALKKGGVDIDQIGADADGIYQTVLNATTQFADAGGTAPNDQISQAVNQKYKPGEKSALDFLRLLAEMLQTHGSSVSDAGTVLGATDEGATEVAGGKKGG